MWIKEHALMKTMVLAIIDLLSDIKFNTCYLKKKAYAPEEKSPCPILTPLVEPSGQ